MMQGLIDNQSPGFGVQTWKRQQVRRVIETAEILLVLKSRLPNLYRRFAVCHSLQVAAQLSIANHQDGRALADLRGKLPYRLDELIGPFPAAEFARERNDQFFRADS